jgi:DNA invertase Pin-like site-specific DNA recombinase
MNRIGYARVSTLEQHLDVQLAKLHGAGCVKIYQEKRSGADADRLELAKCLDYVREGESLVVTKLDRLARSTRHLCAIVDQLGAKGVELVVLDQAIDTSTPVGRFTFHLLAALAEFERSLIHERQREGIVAAQARGVQFGRGKRLSPVQVAALCRQRAQGVLIRDLMAQYGLKKAAIYRYLAQGRHGDAQAEAAD